MSEVVFDAIASQKVPQHLVDLFTPIVDEAKIHFNDDGIHIRAVDAGNVAMAYADLGTAAFESYEAPGSVTQGANVNRIDDRLSVADAGDLVDMSLDMETRKLHLGIGHINHTVGLINPDSIRQEPDVPDLELPNTAVLEGRDLKEVADVADMVSDHLTVEGGPDDERVRFVAEGDIDASDLEFGREETLDGTKLAESTESIFSVDYFQNLVKAIPKDAEVTIQFGEEWPMWLDWQALDGNLEVRQMLAPRIKTR